ncbi:MAG TPA: phytoene/squalene synthase family protein [Terriglobales bacterium]|nr:phytoene/squalene synthase family protein [Terriglobales bacterium]
MSTAVQEISAAAAPSESQLAVAYAVCRDITRAAARNFYYAFLVLPKRKRRALCAVYAFMRRCDDIADDASISVQERRRKLADWLEAWHRAQAGRATDDPILLALTDAQRRFSIPAVLLDQLAHGTAMDLEEAMPDVPGTAAREGDRPLIVHYKTFDDLYLYCYRVASVVGLVCIRIFGYRDQQAEAFAEKLGLAFQLTNIIRDVREDALMERVYLPEEDFARFGVSPYELLSSSDASRFAGLLGLEAERAREYYGAAEKLIPLIEEDSQPALWVLSTIYQRLLEKIVRRQYDVFHGKISVPTREKLVILGKGFLKRLV